MRLVPAGVPLCWLMALFTSSLVCGLTIFARPTPPLDINVLEMWGVVFALKSAINLFPHIFKNARLDLAVDNMTCRHALESQATRSLAFPIPLRECFWTLMRFNLQIAPVYIHTSINPADHPSRLSDPYEFRLQSRVFPAVDALFGPHTLDAFASEVTVQRSSSGLPLPHYSRFGNPTTLGVNVFARNIAFRDGYRENVYAFPPRPLVPAFIRFLRESSASATVIVEELSPPQDAWPSRSQWASSAVHLANPHNMCILERPTKRGGWSQFPLENPLWALRFDFSHQVISD